MSTNKYATISSFDSKTSTTTLKKRLSADYDDLARFVLPILAVTFLAFLLAAITINAWVPSLIITAVAFVGSVFTVWFITQNNTMRDNLTYYYVSNVPKRLGRKVTVMSYGIYDLGTRNVISSDIELGSIHGQKSIYPGNEVSVNTKLVITPFKRHIVETRKLLPSGMWDDAMNSAIAAYEFRA